MTKKTDVTFGRALVVLSALTLGVAAGLYAEAHELSMLWRFVAWGTIGIVAVTAWFQNAIRRRPALFAKLVWAVVGLTILAGIAYLLPDCGLC